MCSCPPMWQPEPPQPTRTPCPPGGRMLSCARLPLSAGWPSPRQKALSWALTRCAPLAGRMQAWVVEVLCLAGPGAPVCTSTAGRCASAFTAQQSRLEEDLGMASFVQGLPVASHSCACPYPDWPVTAALAVKLLADDSGAAGTRWSPGGWVRAGPVTAGENCIQPPLQRSQACCWWSPSSRPLHQTAGI